MSESGPIETRLLEFIQQELLGGETMVGREDDLLSGELLDSVAVLRLATFVENEFQVPMRPADFVVENFRNAAVLTGFVLRCRAEAGSGAPEAPDGTSPKPASDDLLTG